MPFELKQYKMNTRGKRRPNSRSKHYQESQPWKRKSIYKFKNKKMKSKSNLKKKHAKSILLEGWKSFSKETKSIKIRMFKFQNKKVIQQLEMLTWWIYKKKLIGIFRKVKLI